MKAILCADNNWAIGRNGKVLASIQSDLRFFREKTEGYVVVMGRKTLESLPGGRPLDNRINIVLSRNTGLKVSGATVVHSKHELIQELAKYDSDDIFIIGGGHIYELLLPYCDTAYVTKLDYSYEADTWAPNLDYMPEWVLAEESEEQTCFDIEFTFRTYKRKYRTSLPTE
ncbi:MAG: dihydrofolate reductase [Eubacteriales bacterium]|nr:dihydrofolate reductase [Eubacteriales bacterium]